VRALEGKHIVIAGSRKTDEMTAIIEKKGGTAAVRSLQGTVFLAEEELEADLRKFADQGADWAVFTTGIGLETLLTQAEKIGIHTQFLHAVKQAKVAARGYKTVGVLKRLDIAPVAVDDDGTTHGLIQALQPFDFRGQSVVVQLHGEPVPALVQFLEEKGAAVHQILPYRHIPPESETVAALYREITEGLVDAICFTTAVQVRYLFAYAKQHGFERQLKENFQQHTLAVAVGKVTAEALREEGIGRLLVPENERMGAMVVELAQYFEDER
jgi:uroporphyrinogen-III synthase